MEARGLESILAAGLAETDVKVAGDVDRPPSERQVARTFSVSGPLGVTPSSASMVLALPLATELSKLRPWEPLWVPACRAVGHVVSNNPFFKVIHLECGGKTIEATYDELRPPKSAGTSSSAPSVSLSTAIADLEGQVRGLASDLELAPEPEAVADRAAAGHLASPHLPRPYRKARQGASPLGPRGRPPSPRPLNGEQIRSNERMY